MAAPFKDPRTGIYYFRKVIPEPLRPVFGKREYKVSLNTRDPNLARAAMGEAMSTYERLAENARALARNGWSAHASEMVNRWIEQLDGGARRLGFMMTSVAAFAEVRARRGLDISASPICFEPAEDGSPEELIRLRMDQPRRLMTWPQRLQWLMKLPDSDFDWPVARVLEQAGLSGTPAAEQLAKPVCGAFRRRLLDFTIREIEKRDQAVRAPFSPIAMISALPVDAPLSPGPASDGRPIGLTISQAFDAWKTYSKGRPRKPQLVQEWDLAIRRFIAMHGDIDLGLVRAQMVRDFRERLLELPSRPKKSIRLLPLDEQAAIAVRDQLDTLAPATVNKAISALRSVTEHVIDKMSEITLEKNEAKDAKFVEVDDAEDKRLPFEESDMAAIFRDLRLEDSTGISVETLFWIVLLAPFTGCRLEELGTLRPFNIRSEKGIWYIAIERDRAQRRAGEDQEEKSLKTSNSDRDIPIHSLLIRAGFLDFVEQRRREGADWLFPDLKPNKYGKRTYRVSRLFAAYLETCGISDDEKVFHSFRHSIRRHLRGRAKEEIVDLICGHADGKVGRKYGRGADMRPLQEVIELIDYGGPDWDKVAAQGRSLRGLAAEQHAPDRLAG